MDEADREPTDEEIDTAEGIVRRIATNLLKDSAVYERDIMRWRMDTLDLSLVAIGELGLGVDDAIVKHLTIAIVHDLNRLPNRFPKRG